MNLFDHAATADLLSEGTQIEFKAAQFHSSGLSGTICLTCGRCFPEDSDT